jgi:hypothetical protein
VAPSTTGEFDPHIQTGHPTQIVAGAGSWIEAPSTTGEFVPHIQTGHPTPRVAGAAALSSTVARESVASPIAIINATTTPVQRMFLTLPPRLLPAEGAMAVPALQKPIPPVLWAISRGIVGERGGRLSDRLERSPIG